ncbi:hypothetical protein HDU97_009553 [Phlyctochytrium planicorne]|nr:hypothetical protein HDU97_009553 [Phlyctochytrium planicorne]
MSLRRAALMEGCKIILIGDNSTTIGAKVVSKTSDGGGFGLAAGIALESTDSVGIVYFRPFREILASELEKYAELTNIPVPKRLVHEESTKTIQSLAQARGIRMAGKTYNLKA